jgi:hypothetical protein
VQSNAPSGNKMVAKPTAPPELLFVRRGLVYRQFLTNSTTAPPSSGTVSVIITLTVEPQGETNTGAALDVLLEEHGVGAENDNSEELAHVLTTSRAPTTTA